MRSFTTDRAEEHHTRFVAQMIIRDTGATADTRMQ